MRAMRTPFCRTLLALFLALSAPAARAAVASTSSFQDYTANGATTAFAFTFPALATSDVEVLVGGVKQLAGVTVTLNANQATSPGGTATFTVAPANGAAVKVQRTVAMTQGLVLQPYSAFPAKSMEKALDRLAMQAQQLARTDAELSAVIGTGNPNANIAQVTATGSTTARTLADIAADFVNPLSEGAKCDGATDDAPALARAQTHAGTTKGIVITCPLRIASSAGTISAPLRFEGGGQLVSVAGGSITLTGPLTAPVQRIFNLSGGPITFQAITDTIYSRWWGNDGTGEAIAESVFNAGGASRWVQLNSGVKARIVDLAPATTTYQHWIAVTGAGTLNQAKGVGALRLDVTDDTSVALDPAKRGVLYGALITMSPLAGRNNVPFDDVAGILVENRGTQKGTDAFYLGHGAPAGLEWNTAFNSDANLDTGIRLAGYCDRYGIDFADGGTYGIGAVRLPNAVGIVARNAGNTADLNVVKLDSSNAVVLGDTGSGGTAARVQNNGGGYASLEVTSNASSSGILRFTNALQFIGGGIQPATPAGAAQAGSIYMGSGVPTGGNNGDIYFRTDTPGTNLQRIYIKSAGAWVGIL